jgi:ribosomal RNA assembly protein
MEHSFSLKVPKERIAVIIGKEGQIKKELENDTKAKINIDSKEGDVSIDGQDAILSYSLKEVIKAIALGFNPETARLLLKSDYILEIISLNEYSRQKNHWQRLKGRVIGSQGKSRGTIENLTGSYISVYGKHISLIGDAENIDTAKRAVKMLLAGSNHNSVYKWLEKQRKLRGTVF